MTWDDNPSGNMHFIARGVDTLEFLVLSTALWKIPTGGDMACLCPNTACSFRFQWQVECMWYLMHQFTDPKNMCNGTQVPWNCCLNAHYEWAFHVANTVMNTLKNSAISYELPPLPQDVLDHNTMIPTNTHSKAIRTRP